MLIMLFTGYLVISQHVRQTERHGQAHIALFAHTSVCEGHLHTE
jgi:hypothetical protein